MDSTMGTSPYGYYGYNPEGIRISQNSRKLQKKQLRFEIKKIFRLR